MKSVEELKEVLEGYFSKDENKFDSEEDFIGFYSCLWAIYARENITGPSVFSEYVEEVKRPLSSDDPLKETPIDFMALKNEALHSSLLKHFSIDGEQIYSKTNFLSVFYIL